MISISLHGEHDVYGIALVDLQIDGGLFFVYHIKRLPKITASMNEIIPTGNGINDRTINPQELHFLRTAITKKIARTLNSRNQGPESG